MKCETDNCKDCRLQKYQAMCERLLYSQPYTLSKWAFEFSKHKTFAGMCYYDEQLIVLSKYFVLHNSEEKIINTMLHEIAHALAPRGSGHNSKWRKIFKYLLIEHGQPINVSRCYGDETKMPKGKYRITCTCCGDSYTQHKKTKKIKRAFETKGYMIGRWHRDCGMKSKDRLYVEVI